MSNEITLEKHQLLLFFDTEFTDFINMDLISIGIVSNLSNQFYAENAEFEQTWCNDFVKSEVLAKLEGGKLALPYDQLKTQLHAWFNDLFSQYSEILCVFDYAGDWSLLCDLLIDYPMRKEIKGLSENLAKDVELYFLHSQSIRHHALHDAKALLQAYKSKYAL